MILQIDNQVSISEFNPMTDKSDLIYHINDIDVANNTLTIPYPYTSSDADFYFNLIKELDSKHGKPTSFAIRFEGKLIGGIGRIVCYGIDSHKDEIGYYIGKDYRNKGIMTSVVSGFTDFLHKEHHLVRIEAGVFLQNKSSMKVLEKAGFQYECVKRKYHKKGNEYLNAKMYVKIY
jgi:[ribosomal protein S5]-alanine N-acetyltransferase